MLKTKYIIVGTVIVSLLAGCGPGAEYNTPETAPVNVKVGVAKVSSEKQSIHVSGRVEAGSRANISTRMMGNVIRMMVQPGERVKKGELLLTISSVDLKAKKAQVAASILQAQSVFDNAKKDFERFKVLYGKGSASEKELDNMTTRYETTKAGLEAAEQMEKEVNAQFAFTNIRAPFNGVVANTFVKVGDIANPGMPLATVEGTTAYEAVVMVSESQISKINIGAKAKVVVKSINLSIAGVVKEVSPSSNNTGGQFLVKIDLENTDGVLPGMFVNADISIDEVTIVTTSPFVQSSALIRNGQLTGIYTLGNENTAILRWVRTGRKMGENVELLSGISEGEKYILEPEAKLFNGAKVFVNN